MSALNRRCNNKSKHGMESFSRSIILREKFSSGNINFVLKYGQLSLFQNWRKEDSVYTVFELNCCI